jgi:hypothetical protein
LRSTYDWAGEGGQTLSWYGISVGTAGDVNGDGYAEVIVGAKDYNGTYVNEGRALIYYGNASAGVSLLPRQARFNSGLSIAPLGESDSSNGLRIYTSPSSPFGRGGLQPETEFKPVGTPFNGSETMWVGYYDNVAPGVPRYTPFSNLFAGTAYHWRVRMRYSPVTNPFLPASRWLTMPWNGWNETDFRTAVSAVFLPLVVKIP